MLQILKCNRCVTIALLRGIPTNDIANPIKMMLRSALLLATVVVAMPAATAQTLQPQPTPQERTSRKPNEMPVDLRALGLRKISSGSGLQKLDISIDQEDVEAIIEQSVEEAMESAVEELQNLNIELKEALQELEELEVEIPRLEMDLEPLDMMADESDARVDVEGEEDTPEQEWEADLDQGSSRYVDWDEINKKDSSKEKLKEAKQNRKAGKVKKPSEVKDEKERSKGLKKIN